MKFLVDSGASHCFLCEDIARELGLKLEDGGPSRTVVLADGSSQVCTARVQAVAQMGEGRYNLEMFVLPMRYEAILGMSWLKEHNPKIDWRQQIVSLEAPLQVVVEPEEEEGLVISALQLKKALKRGEEVFALIELGSSEAATEADPDVKNLLAEFKDVFSSALPGVPPVREVEHTITLEPGSTPPRQAPYQTPLKFLPEVDRQIRALKENGLIRDSNSPFAAPILCVKKPDGSIRLCCDYRALNKVSVKDKFPLPRIDELLDRLRGAKYFSKLDLTQGYHQVRVREEDIHKTAFTTRFGQFEWLVMPFGVSGGPATFQRLMNNVLKKFLDDFVSAYLDDILVYSETKEEHLEHLRLVLTALRENKLLVKESKCLFMARETDFLGHRVTPDGIAVQPSKIQTITEWPAPTSVPQLRSFLGLAGFYQRFVKDFAKITVPLTDLLRKDQTFTWGEKENAAFEKLKTALTTTPVMRQPDPNLSFILHTDASDFAIGAVLSQDDGNGSRPIAFTSRKLHKSERNYAVHEKELLAIVDAFRVWRYYLLGAHTDVFTDHNSIKYLQTQPSLTTKQIHWAGKLQEYDHTIYYQPGETNVAADALSRRPDLMEISAMSTMTLDGKFAEDIKQAYAGDPIFADIVKKLQGKPSTPTGQNTFKLDRDLLYMIRDERPRLCVPNDLKIKTLLLQEAHDTAIAGHLGVSKTYASLQAHYFWPNLFRDVQKFVLSCHTCQTTKPSQQKPAGLLQPLPPPDGPWEQVSLDYIMPLPKTKAGYDGILVFVDAFTKMAHFAPTKTTVTAQETARLFFDNVFRLHGMPLKIVSDRDRRFSGNFWRGLFDLVGTKLGMSTAFHPQTDGQTERTNRILEQMLRAQCNYRQDDWDIHLTAAEFAYNNAVQSSTKFTPFVLSSGRAPLVPSSLLRPTPTLVPAVDEFVASMADNMRVARDNIHMAQYRQKQYADEGRREENFQVGERVMVSTKHFTPRADMLRPAKKLRRAYAGPYKILEVISSVAYRVDLPAGLQVHPVFHVSLLKRYEENPKDFISRESPPAPEIQADGSEKYEVDKILDKRVITRGRAQQVSYLVSWKGYGLDEATWEPLGNLDTAQEAIQEFEQGS